MKTCPTCHQTYPDENRVLSPDGSRLSAESRDERECPHCAERILRKARVCKHCGHEVVPPLGSGISVHTPLPAKPEGTRQPPNAKPGSPLSRKGWLRMIGGIVLTLFGIAGVLGAGVLRRFFHLWIENDSWFAIGLCLLAMGMVLCSRPLFRFLAARTARQKLMIALGLVVLVVLAVAAKVQYEGQEKIRKAAAPPAPSSLLAIEANVGVPFVGCEDSGMVDVTPAPKGTEKVVTIHTGEEERLSYYKSPSGPGVLGPRGWSCSSNSGSGGSTLRVTPQGQGATNGTAGPMVVVSSMSGGTSGRFGVAQVIARVFPAHEAFVRNVMKEGLMPASEFPSGPYPKDKVTVRSDTVVEYETAPHSKGLGTDAGLTADDNPIQGIAILEGEYPDVVLVAVRLPADMKDLAFDIIQQVERENSPRPSGGEAGAVGALGKDGDSFVLYGRTGGDSKATVEATLRERGYSSLACKFTSWDQTNHCDTASGNYRLSLTFFRGELETFSFDFPKSEWEQQIRFLKGRLGEPDDAEKTTVTEVITWDSKRTTECGSDAARQCPAEFLMLSTGDSMTRAVYMYEPLFNDAGNEFAQRAMRGRIPK